MLYHIRWRGNVTNFMPHQHPIGYPTTSATTFIIDEDDVINFFYFLSNLNYDENKYLIHITSEIDMKDKSYYVWNRPSQKIL